MTDDPAPPTGRQERTAFDPTRAIIRAAELRGESVDTLLDRNVAELLQEVRVVFTGVQLLFAFLLGLAFSQRFLELDGFQVAAYLVGLLTAALAAIVLIAPVPFHRMLFRRRKKAALVVVADRFLAVGLVLVVTAITSSVLLVLDVVLGRGWAILGSSLTAVVGLLTWYVLPLAVRRGRLGTVPPPDGLPPAGRPADVSP
jgi:amino acid transporter